MLPIHARPESSAPARTTAALLGVALAACSTMPPATMPAHVDYAFDRRLTVAADGRLPFPMTTRAVVVRRVDLNPPPRGERFDAGTRSFVYAPGARVRIVGELRAYAADDGDIPTLDELLPR